MYVYITTNQLRKFYYNILKGIRRNSYLDVCMGC